MDFNEKLQNLRKQKGLTQEELASALFVSRTAVSKWESGRGYPNIDSLKEIAKYFEITIDELLSGEELLTLAEQDSKKRAKNYRDLVFGILDIGVAMFFFLPFFKGVENNILRIVYFAAVALIMLCGLLTLTFQNLEPKFWAENKNKLSIILNILGVILFIVSPQPYAAAFLFTSLIIKALISKKGY